MPGYEAPGPAEQAALAAQRARERADEAARRELEVRQAEQQRPAWLERAPGREGYPHGDRRGDRYRQRLGSACSSWTRPTTWWPRSGSRARTSPPASGPGGARQPKPSGTTEAVRRRGPGSGARRARGTWNAAVCGSESGGRAPSPSEGPAAWVVEFGPSATVAEDASAALDGMRAADSVARKRTPGGGADPLPTALRIQAARAIPGCRRQTPRL
jgi:hypothetical protein